MGFDSVSELAAFVRHSLAKNGNDQGHGGRSTRLPRQPAVPAYLSQRRGQRRKALKIGPSSASNAITSIPSFSRPRRQLIVAESVHGLSQSGTLLKSWRYSPTITIHRSIRWSTTKIQTKSNRAKRSLVSIITIPATCLRKPSTAANLNRSNGRMLTG